MQGKKRQENARNGNYRERKMQGIVGLNNAVLYTGTTSAVLFGML